MNWLRAILCIALPPLAVIDRGPRAFALTFILTLIGWLPGVAAALVYNSVEPKPRSFTQDTGAL